MLHNVLLWGLDILDHWLPPYTSGILANPCHSWKMMLQQSKKKKTLAYCMSEHAISKMKFLESKFYLRMTDVLLHHINACLHICRKCPFVLSGYMPVCLSICLFVCVYQHRSHWIDFHEVWYWWLLWKSSQENPYLIKIGQNSGALYLNEVWFIVASDVKLS